MRGALSGSGEIFVARRRTYEVMRGVLCFAALAGCGAHLLVTPAAKHFIYCSEARECLARLLNPLMHCSHALSGRGVAHILGRGALTQCALWALRSCASRQAPAEGRSRYL